jgi:hypothetical protein
MTGKTCLSAWICVTFLISGSAQAATFSLGFEGCPAGPVEGEPGEVKRFEIFPTLTTAENDLPWGPVGWTLSIEVIGGELDSIEVKGIIIDAIVNDDHDCDAGTPPIHYDHYPFDLADTFTNIAAKATGADPSPLNDPNRKGAISAIILDTGCGTATLQPNGTVRIAKMVVAARIPEDGAEREVVLRYQDGLRSTVSRRVDNVVTFDRVFHRNPVLGECRFTVRKQPPPILALGFDGCPRSPVEGAPGESRTFEIFPTLTTLANFGPDGPDIWAISVGISGGRIKAIDLGGLRVSTVFDHDGDPATPPLDPYYLDLGTARPRDAELAAFHSDPSRIGAISMVMLDRERKMVLHQNGTERIARIVVEADVPVNEEPAEVVLRFEDGFGSRRNWINLDDVYEPPALGECRFTLVKGTPSMQLPGDANQSGSLDLSDAVTLIGILFQTRPERFPCGDGSPSDPGNRALLDWQGDGAIDITDVVAALQFLFLGGPAHRLAIPGNELRGCVPIYVCPKGTGCR